MKKVFLCSYALSVFFVSGCENSLDDVHKQVAEDVVAQYNLSVKGGDPIEICVQAGVVVAAFNQAQDEENYLKWKKIEKADCKKAGM